MFYVISEVAVLNLKYLAILTKKEHFLEILDFFYWKKMSHSFWPPSIHTAEKYVSSKSTGKSNALNKTWCLLYYSKYHKNLVKGCNFFLSSLWFNKDASLNRNWSHDEAEQLRMLLLHASNSDFKLSYMVWGIHDH